MLFLCKPHQHHYGQNSPNQQYPCILVPTKSPIRVCTTRLIGTLHYDARTTLASIVHCTTPRVCRVQTCCTDRGGRLLICNHVSYFLFLLYVFGESTAIHYQRCYLTGTML